MADDTLRYATGGLIPADQAATSDDPPAWLTRCRYETTRPAPTDEPWPAFLAGSA